MFKRFRQWLRQPREYTNDDYFVLCLYCTIVVLLSLVLIFDLEVPFV